MKLEESIQIDTALDDVWRILALDYENVALWARAVSASEAIIADFIPEGAPVGGRTCEAAFGPVQERITRFDSLENELTYEAHGEAIPSFIKRLQGRWPNTMVSLAFDAEIMPPFSILLGWLVRRQFAGAIKDTPTDLKHFAESRDVHPEKAAAMA